MDEGAGVAFGIVVTLIAVIAIAYWLMTDDDKSKEIAPGVYEVCLNGVLHYKTQRGEESESLTIARDANERPMQCEAKKK